VESLDEGLPPFAARDVGWRPRPKFQGRWWLHVSLCLLTFVSTTFAGVGHYLSFRSDFLATSPSSGVGTLGLPVLEGLWYSVTALAILGFHEMGHYLACRYYDVDASLPYFLPMPFLLFGTLGAFIRIREPIPTKRKLFDIGIAGPLAGFLVAVPALIFGLSLSRMVRVPDDFVGFELGEPLLFQWVSTLIWGSTPEGYSLNLHPVAFAAWFGLLATSLNLFPIGQLDGGHISYAVFGRRSSTVSLVMMAVAVALTFVSTSWLVWTLLLAFSLYKFGRHHPPTFDEHEPLDRTRLVLAGFALVVFVLSFTPAPARWIDLVR
jgi:membrane-associated protease RseP (regulator of RpoE activity)